MTKKLKQLEIIFVEEFGESEAVFDGDELVTYWFGNDANWRDEYFGDLMEHVGVEMIRPQGWRHDELKKLFAARLKADGLNWADEEEEETTEVNLTGLSFVFTGTLDSMTRKDAENSVRAAKGTVGSSVTNGTTYLVCGTNPGKNKVMAAKIKNITMINERQFINLFQV